MNVRSLILALLAVLGISAGQILFKLAAQALEKNNAWWAWATNTHLIAALGIYAVATVCWVLALQKSSLNMAYAIIGLAFILVPMASAFWLGEKLTKGVLIGGVLILAGIIISTSYKG